MWICLNNSFVSIVEDWENQENVYVRGRRLSDVLNFVGDGYQIIKTDSNDYRFRAKVTKFELSKMLAKCADKISYGNFKDSVKDPELKQFYTEVWGSGVRNLDPDWIKRRRR